MGRIPLEPRLAIAILRYALPALRAPHTVDDYEPRHPPFHQSRGVERLVQADRRLLWLPYEFKRGGEPGDCGKNSRYSFWEAEIVHRWRKTHVVNFITPSWSFQALEIIVKCCTLYSHTKLCSITVICNPFT